MALSRSVRLKTCLACLCALTFGIGTAQTTLGPPLEWSDLNLEVETLSRQGQHQKALEAAQRLMQIADRQLKPLSIQMMTSLARLGQTYRAVGQPRAAEPHLRRASAIAERMDPSPPNFVRAAVLGGVAGVCAEQGRIKEAEELYKSALAFLDPPEPRHRSMEIRLRQESGSLYLRLRNPAMAEALLRSAIQVAEGHPEAAGIEAARAWASLGSLEEGRHNFKAAQENYERALRLSHAVGPNGTLLSAGILANLADLAQKDGPPGEAAALQTESLNTLTRSGNASQASLADGHSRLARFQLLGGQYEQALATASIAEKICEEHYPTSILRRGALTTIEDTQIALKRQVDAGETRRKIDRLSELIDAQRPEPVVELPVTRAQPAPEYPPLARKLNQEGGAIVRVLVSEAGSVKDAQLIGSSGYRLLDDAAVKAALNGEYEPGKTVGGKAAPVWMHLPFHFQLR